MFQRNFTVGATRNLFCLQNISSYFSEIPLGLLNLHSKGPFGKRTLITKFTTPITFACWSVIIWMKRWRSRLMNWRRRFGRVRKSIRIMLFIIIFGRRFFSDAGPNGKVFQMKIVMNGLSMIRLFWIQLLSSCARPRQSRTTVGIMMNLMKSVLGFSLKPVGLSIDL